tara:strand:- start:255 stop:542 length:288 start_codon:yes stop_codon:yes gene_type:complete
MENQNNGMAIASMVCGICSVVLYFFFGIVLAVIAVILGHVHLSNINKNPKQYGGKGMAIAGLVCGYVSIGFSVIGLLFLGSLFSFTESLTDLLDV